MSSLLQRSGTLVSSVVARGLSTGRGLTLTSNGLMGTLPSSISLFMSLSSLNLTNNSLAGTIPTTLGVMTTLRFVLRDSDNDGTSL